MRIDLIARVLPIAVVGANLFAAGPAFEKQADGIVLPLDQGFLKIEVRAENIMRVAYAKDESLFAQASLMVAPRRGPAPEWQVTPGAGELVVATASLKARIDLATGAVSFLDGAGRPIIAEKAGGRRLTPADVQGAQTFHAQQQWESRADESLYGLGQNQLGLVDIKGYDLDLWQHNGSVVIPLLVSSAGYGILWDNPSYTRFGDLRPFEAIPGVRLFDADGKPGGLTGSYFADARFEHRVARQADAKIDILAKPWPPSNTAINPGLPERGDFSVRWEGGIEPETTGDYQFQTYSDGDLKVWIDGQLVANHWRQGWLPWYDLARVRLEAGRRHSLRVDWARTTIRRSCSCAGRLRRPALRLRSGRRWLTGSTTILCPAPISTRSLPGIARSRARHR